MQTYNYRYNAVWLISAKAFSILFIQKAHVSKGEILGRYLRDSVGVKEAEILNKYP